jgi:hypothetical protein
MTTDLSVFTDKIADTLDEMASLRNRIARSAVHFARPVPHVCDPGWQRERVIEGPAPTHIRSEVWTLDLVLAMPEGTDSAIICAAGAACQSLRVEVNPLAVRYHDDVSILDGAGNVAGVTLFRNLPESLQHDLVDALKAKREQATRAEGEIIGHEWGSKVPNNNEFQPREVKPQFRDLTTEYVCARWSRGVRVAKCDNAAGDTHYYVFDVASGEATARVGSKSAAFARARVQGRVTNG